MFPVPISRLGHVSEEMSPKGNGRRMSVVDMSSCHDRLVYSGWKRSMRAKPAFIISEAVGALGGLTRTVLKDQRPLASLPPFLAGPVMKLLAQREPIQGE